MSLSAIDAVYVINCKQGNFLKSNPSLEGKYESVDLVSPLEITPYIKHLFRSNDFNWNKDEMARGLAHYKLWQKLSLGDLGNRLLILEDNVVVEPYFITEWNKMAHDMSGAGLIYLGGVSSNKRKDLKMVTEDINGSFARIKARNNEILRKVRQFDFLAHSYILTRKAAGALCALIDKLGFLLTVDKLLANSDSLLTIHFTKTFLCQKYGDKKTIFDYKAVYICPDHNEKYHTRKLHMDKLLSDLGFTDIVHHKSGNEKYPICLSLATIDVLKKYMDVPFILFEDDIECTGNMELDSVANADAVYLGLSEYASHPTENRNVYPSQIVPYSNSQVRIENMLAAHAILYISKAYKQAVIDILETNKFKCVNDIAISRIQKDYLVLANMKPMFFQSKKFNPPYDNGFCVEKATNIIIDSEMKFVQNKKDILLKRDIIILDCDEIKCPKVLMFVFVELCQGFKDLGFNVKIINNISEITNNTIVFMGNSFKKPNVELLLNYYAPDAIYIGWYWQDENTNLLKHFIYTYENFLNPDKRINLIKRKPNNCPLLLRASEHPNNIGTYEKNIIYDYCYMGWDYRPDLVPSEKFKGLYHGVRDHNKFLSYNDRKKIYLSSKFALGIQSNENINFKHVSQRIYEGLAYGCIVLTNSSAACEQTNNIAVFVQSKQDIEDKINFYNENYALMRQKQQEGYEFVKLYGTNHYSIDKFATCIKNTFGITI